MSAAEFAVPFGKYKGRDISVFLSDDKYLEWFFHEDRRDDFKTRYPRFYAEVEKRHNGRSSTQVIPFCQYDSAQTNIVPFGKYKGQMITEMLADEGYVEFLKNQPGIERQYPTIYNIIISRNAMSSALSPTPEHNKLQSFFLKRENCQKLLSIVMGGHSRDHPSWELIREVDKAMTDIDEKLSLRSQLGITDESFLYDNVCLGSEFEGRYNWDLIISSKTFEDKGKFAKITPDIFLNILEKCSRSVYRRDNKNIYLVDGVFDIYILFENEIALSEGEWRIFHRKCKEIDLEYGRRSERYTKASSFTDWKTASECGRNYYSREHRRYTEEYFKWDGEDEWRRDLTTPEKDEYPTKPKEIPLENSYYVARKTIPVTFSLSKGYDHYPISFGEWLFCEIKPQLGDDYPAVLRKMKQQISLTTKDPEPRHGRIFILIVDIFESKVITYDELKQIFGQTGILVVSMDEIRSCSKKLLDYISYQS